VTAASEVVVDFLGTGNFLAPGRYWNSFVLDESILVEPSPTALPNLRRCGLAVDSLDVIVVSHFHADHTFGWPFLLLEIIHRRESRPIFVVGPPGVEAFLVDMLVLGGVPNVLAEATEKLDLRFVEVDGSTQEAGPLRFQAIEVEHVPHLRCFGYLFHLAGRVVGYSGDTRRCDGLDKLAERSDVLILECNGPHAPGLPITHMDVDAVRELRERHPSVPFVLTHLGADVDTSELRDVVVPDDFSRLTI